jgi:hypothetical protein
MQDTSSFAAAGLRAIGEGLADLAFRGGLERARVTLSRTLALKIRARLRLLETMLRRLLVVMASALDVRPAIKAPVIPAKAGTSCNKTEPSESLMPRPRKKGFALMPCERDRPGLDPSVFETSARTRRAIEIAPLLHRYRTVLALLEDPDRAARRMARRLARLRAAGAHRPIFLAQAFTHRLGVELGLVAEVLPALANRALSGWNDSG